MARDDLIQLDGTVTAITGGHHTVELDNGIIINARLGGRMRRFKIRIIVGDRVAVSVSPYDPTHGLISRRMDHGESSAVPRA